MDNLSKIETVFLSALEKGSPAERAAYLDEACQGDPELRQSVERLLQAHPQVGSFLQLPPGASETTPPQDQGPLQDQGTEGLPRVPRIRYFGDYELLEEIGRGGMGVVYKARQRSLNRLVAVKMILSGWLANTTEVDRFRREAQAVARLDHPNIVPIYEVGVHQGQHYFSMKLIEGNNLSQDLPVYRTNRQTAALLLAQVARAVNHAHERGIIHRDLKPENILLDAGKQPHVTDFGLAKRLDGSVTVARTGGVVGTASYMSPEQAAAQGHQLSAATDIYSLGAILYEMLTGQPPFRGQTIMETLRQVVERDPACPRTLDSRIERDLETICLKSIDKRPQRRYLSAAALADDLDNWRTIKPIRARRVGQAEQLLLWCRRRPVAAALLAVAAALLLLVVGVTVAGAIYIRNANFAAKIAEDKVQEAKYSDLSTIESVEEIEQQQKMLAAARQEYKDWFATKRVLEKPKAELALKQHEKSRALDYPSDMRKAARFAEIEDFMAVLELLDKRRPGPQDTDVRQWEWYYLRALAARQSLVEPGEADFNSSDGWYFTLSGRKRPVMHLEWSPQGDALAVYDDELRVLDLRTGAERFTLRGYRSDTWSPDGRYFLVVDEQGAAKVLDARTGWPVAQVPPKFRSFAWNPDSRRLAASSQAEVVVFDALDGRRGFVLHGHKAAVKAMAWSPDGQRLVSGSDDGNVKVWDVATRSESSTLDFDGGEVNALCWRPDGGQLCASYYPLRAGRNHRYPRICQVWDLASQKAVFSFSSEFRNSDLCWSGDGCRLWLGEILLDAATGRPLYSATSRCAVDRRELRQAIVGIGGTLESTLVGLPDGERFQDLAPWLSTGDNWTQKFGLPKSEATTTAAWRSDGRGVALGSDSGQVYICRVTPHGAGARSLRLPEGACLNWSPKVDQFLVFHGNQNLVQYGRLPPGQPLQQLGALDSTFRERICTLSADGKRVAVAFWDDTIEVWDTVAARCIHRLPPHPKVVSPSSLAPIPQIVGLFWSPRSTRLAALRSDNTIKVWDALSGEEIFRVDYGGRIFGSNAACAWSPDDGQIALVGNLSDFSGIAIWDVGTGRSLQKIPAFGSLLAWSPDGKTLAADGGSPRRLLHLYDPVTGNDIATVPCPDFIPTILGWSPDGRRLAWYVANGATCGIYDLQTGKTTSLEKYSSGSQILWKPDGKELGTAAGGQVIIYDAISGKKSSKSSVPVNPETWCWTEEGLIGARIDYLAGHFNMPVIIVTNATTGKTVRMGPDKEVELARPTYVMHPNEGLDTKAVSAPNGQLVAIAGETTRWAEKIIANGAGRSVGTPRLPEVWIFDPASGRKVRTLALSATPLKLYWIAGGRLEVATQRGPEVWNVESGRKEGLETQSLPLARKLSPDGKHWAVMQSNKRPITCQIWDATTHQFQRELGADAISSGSIMEWSPDGKYLASGAGQVRVWDVASGKEISRLVGHGDPVEAIMWSPDGHRLIAPHQGQSTDYLAYRQFQGSASVGPNRRERNPQPARRGGGSGIRAEFASLSAVQP